MTASRTPLPSIGTRALGVVGILGGLGLLTAFVVEIPSALNSVRLVLFCAGAIAIAIAALGRHAAVSRRLALAGTIPLVVANAVYIAWILLSLGEERPFAGDFGIVGLLGGLRLLARGCVVRGRSRCGSGSCGAWAALVLVAGSLLAILGIDRLGLTSQANPTIFGPIALAGIALNGVAWILLGLELAMPRLRRRREGASRSWPEGRRPSVLGRLAAGSPMPCVLTALPDRVGIEARRPPESARLGGPAMTWRPATGAGVQGQGLLANDAPRRWWPRRA